MKIWWCEEHKASGDADGESCWFGEEYEGGMHCRMVEMRLVSLDALVVEKVGGEWPEWAQTAIWSVLNGNHFPIAGVDAYQVLDALSETQR